MPWIVFYYILVDGYLCASVLLEIDVAICGSLPIKYNCADIHLGQLRTKHQLFPLLPLCWAAQCTGNKLGMRRPGAQPVHGRAAEDIVPCFPQWVLSWGDLISVPARIQKETQAPEQQGTHATSL